MRGTCHYAWIDGCRMCELTQKKMLKARAAVIESLKPVKTEPEKKPEWTTSVPINKQLAFVGLSGKSAEEKDVRNELLQMVAINL